MRICTVIALFGLLFFAACKKENSSDNPYDSWKGGTKSPVVADKPIDPNTIQGLHKNIFKPTCSNSGCHDGNFEPDFRTIESTYNSLVNRNTLNTDPSNPQFSKRVLPFDASQSMILHRLSTLIPGTQGRMPLNVDPGSDWPANKSEYVQNITNWINDGAKDQFGNTADAIDFVPQMGGLLAYADGSATSLSRSGFNPISVPPGTASLKLLIAYIDDKTPVNQFDPSSINFSLNPNVYDSTVQALTVEPSAINGLGLNGITVDYWHSITVNVADLGVSGDVVWIRTETGDKVNPLVFIPSVNTSFNLVKYFALKLE